MAVAAVSVAGSAAAAAAERRAAFC
jgi:hypothetical protein